MRAGVVIVEFMAVDLLGNEEEVRRILPLRKSNGVYRLGVRYLPQGRSDPVVFERMRKLWQDLLEREGIGRDW